MSAQWDVIVVGGGLAGLAAGAVAAAAGASTVVLEAHQAGGRARSVNRDGYVLNMGAHALFAGGSACRVLASLGITPQGAHPPLGRYRALVGGRQHQLPTGGGSLMRTTLLGPRSKAQLSVLLLRLSKLDPSALVGRSVTDWLDGQDLRPDVAAVVRALVRLSTYASDLDEFGADAAIGQVQVAAAAGVLYLDGGWAQLTDQLATRVEVRTRTRVLSVEPAAGRVEVRTPDGPLIAGRVVVAPGSPAAARTLLPDAPDWSALGPPVTAACLDVGVRTVPSPGYVLGLDDPVYATVQGPPARQAPPGHAVVGALRYGARNAVDDRAQLDQLLVEAGVRSEDIVTSRFLARMVVAGAAPRAASGGLTGRPSVTDTGMPGVYLAGDWVGDTGLLADTSMASGQAAALLAVGASAPPSIIV